MDKVKDLHVEKRQSQKTGKDYFVLVVVFKNGYTFETLLSREQAYIITSM